MSVKCTSETARQVKHLFDSTSYYEITRPRSMLIADYERNVARVVSFVPRRPLGHPMYPPGRTATSAYHLSHATLTSLVGTFWRRDWGWHFAGVEDMEIVWALGHESVACTSWFSRRGLWGGSAQSSFFSQQKERYASIRVMYTIWNISVVVMIRTSSTLTLMICMHLFIIARSCKHLHTYEILTFPSLQVECWQRRRRLYRWYVGFV